MNYTKYFLVLLLLVLVQAKAKGICTKCITLENRNMDAVLFQNLQENIER